MHNANTRTKRDTPKHTQILYIYIKTGLHSVYTSYTDTNFAQRQSIHGDTLYTRNKRRSGIMNIVSD